VSTRTVDWAHGSVTVQSLGGMLGPVVFRVEGREVQPMYAAPWVDSPEAEGMTGIMKGLRGEWPCVPFGMEGPKPGVVAAWAGLDGRETGLPADAGPHGESSNLEWTFTEGAAGEIAMVCVYPAAHPIERVERVVRPDPAGPAVDLTLRVFARRDCRLPIGLHPTFRLPEEDGMAVLEPGPYREIRSFPATVAPGATLFAPDQVFQSLTEVPGVDGGTVDVSRMPRPEGFEELLQIVGASGQFALWNRAEGYRVHLTWDAAHYPSQLLWMSNRGRKEAPWSGRHLALGTEPICAAFDLGTAISAGVNPITRSGVATAHVFRAGEPFETRYRISVSAAKLGGPDNDRPEPDLPP